MNPFLIGALALGVWGLSQQRSSQGAAPRYFKLPDGRSIPESQLPSLGYVNIGGKWWTQQQAAKIAQQNGIDLPGTPQGSGDPVADTVWATLGALLNASLSIVPLFQNNNNNNT